MQQSEKEYKHNWYLKNKSRLQVRNRQYRLSHMQEFRNYNQTYYWKNRDEIEKKKKTWRKKQTFKMKQEVVFHYSKGLMCCACCGENQIEFLSVDHINGKGNEERRKLGTKGGTGFYNILKRNGYPIGYQILCYNCNLSKGHVGYCPHILDNEWEKEL